MMTAETLKAQINVYGGTPTDSAEEDLREKLLDLITEQLRTWKLAGKETDLADEARAQGITAPSGKSEENFQKLFDSVVDRTCWR